MNRSKYILGGMPYAFGLLVMLHLTALTLQGGVIITNLYFFSGGNDGGDPEWALTQGSNGNFYGTTSEGGTNGYGSIFEISPAGIFNGFYSFTAVSYSGLIQGSDGNFYGTTSYSIYLITPSGSETDLAEINDGSRPTGGLIRDNDGNLYGTMVYGGDNKGSVFELYADGTLTNLFEFNGITDGGYPYAALTLGKDGNFYGTTRGGVHSNPGTIFSISPTGAFTNLYSFTGGSDGGNPYASLIQGSDGNFYGTTSVGGILTNGTIFRFSPTEGFTNLYSFMGGADGAEPLAGLTQGDDGNYYGTSFAGGTYGYGTLFEISPQGKFTTLYSFMGGNDGAHPQAGLVLATDGSFYGTTTQGGAGSSGVVFRLTVESDSSISIALDAAFGFKNGAFGFDVSGPRGSNVVIQASRDLQIWTPVQTNQIVNGSIYFSESQSSTNHQRFYRVLLP